MKERMVAMEQTCAQMAAQMTTMMSMMSNVQKMPAEHGSPSEGLCDRQVTFQTYLEVIALRLCLDYGFVYHEKGN